MNRAAQAKPSRLLDLAFVGVLVIGAFLRLFQIDATQFWNDSAGTYNLAYDVAALHGIPVTGIHSSIGSFTPPVPVYIYLLPALLGSPTLGNVETALAIVATIAVTYYICRRYLNQTIGLIAALLFSVSMGSIEFSRFIWQPSLQAPFTVLLIAAVLAGVAGKRRGWFAWALPFLGLAIQMHPVTAALFVLILLGWLLAPETVRLRDLLIGVAVTIALYIPTLIFEIMSGFYDIRVFLHAARGKPVISATVFHRFLDINSLIQLPNLADWPLYRALNIAWEALLLCGLLYLAWRVVAPILRAIRDGRDGRAALGAAGGRRWRAWVAGALGWMRADGQARWRLDLVVLLWPSLILVAQIRHTTPIEPHYLIATFPAQFIAAAMLLYDLRAAVPRLATLQRVAVAGAFSVGSIVVAIVCVTQIIAIPASYLGPQSRSLQAQKAGLARAQQLAAQYHVSRVVFQTDFQTTAATNYMLETGYHFPAPTQIMSSGSCLPGASAGSDRVLYLMTGNVSRWESVITRIPGVRDLMGALPAGDYYRAYVLTPDQITAFLQPFGALSLASPITFSGPTGDAIVANRIWQAPQPDRPTPVLAVEAHLASAQAADPFHLMYGFKATLDNAANQPVASANMYCTISPWIPGQPVYYMIPQIMSAGVGQTETLALAAGNRVYNAQDHLRIGSLRLISTYDLTSVEYITTPTTSQTFAVAGCGQSVTCANANTAALRSSG